MRIAIVDDCCEDRETLRDLIAAYFAERAKFHEDSHEFCEFSNAESFLAAFVPGYFDIAVLDIYMDTISGMEAAKRVASSDRHCCIIIATSSLDHTLEGYSVHAAGYIVKPPAEHLPELYRALDFCAEMLAVGERSFELSMCSGLTKVMASDIIYLDRVRRKPMLHLRGAVVELNGEFSDSAASLLEDRRFFMCYRSVVVNMDFIEAPIGNEFLLRTGERLPISREKKKIALTAFADRFMDRGRA